MKGATISILEAFSDLTDPRMDRRKMHRLSDIITISICAVIAGGEGWEDMRDFARGRESWLRKFLALENGIPSADTFRRVFERLDTEKFHECFMHWVSGLREALEGENISLDGKTLRGAFDKAGTDSALHIVSAWSSESGLALAQQEVDAKSNEIKAIPKILDIIALKGCIVTIDAMGCQKEIVGKIRERGADYVIGLKDNQKSFHEDVATFFQGELSGDTSDFEIDTYETIEKGHGRIETRKYFITSDIAWLGREEDWNGLTSIGMVEAIREVRGKPSKEVRYFISSIRADAKKFAKAVRSHWGIENSLHWVLDVTFNEDPCRVRRDLAAENLALLRKIALNILKADTTTKKSIRKKRKMSVWDDTYMFHLLTQKTKTAQNMGI